MVIEAELTRWRDGEREGREGRRRRWGVRDYRMKKRRKGMGERDWERQEEKVEKKEEVARNGREG